jgi:hypothetical protein
MDDLGACEIDGITPSAVKSENAIALFQAIKNTGSVINYIKKLKAGIH